MAARTRRSSAPSPMQAGGARASRVAQTATLFMTRASGTRRPPRPVAVEGQPEHREDQDLVEVVEEVQVEGDDDDLLVELPDHLADPAACDEIEQCRRLVHDDDVRPRDQDRRQGEQSFLAPSGQQVSRMVAVPLEAVGREGGVDPALRPRAWTGRVVAARKATSSATVGMTICASGR